MPNTKQAIKMVRKTKKRTQYNTWRKNNYKEALKEFKNQVAQKAEKPKIQEALKILQKNLDKAAKNKVIHKNKAARLKARAARLVPRA